VALGEPGTPVICWAAAITVPSMTAAMNTRAVTINDFVLMSFLLMVVVSSAGVTFPRIS